MGICTPDVLNEIAARYGTEGECLRKIHESVSTRLNDEFYEKAVYEYNRDNHEHVLRILAPEYIDFAYLEGEIAWISYLADNGLGVPRPVASQHGHAVEYIRDKPEKTALAVTAYEKVAGRQIRFDDAKEWNGGLFRTYGRAIGMMHRLTVDFLSAQPSVSRIEWDRQPWFHQVRDYVPASETVILDRLNETLEAIGKLPTDGRSFGLIHGDAHPWNVLLNGDRIILLDFDFCEYSWYVGDIAYILFYAVMAPCDNMSREKFAIYFLEHFLDGYERENALDRRWLAQMPLFLQARLIAKYILKYPLWRGGRLTERAARILMERKHKIANNIPYLDVDFSGL